MRRLSALCVLFVLALASVTACSSPTAPAKHGTGGCVDTVKVGGVTTFVATTSCH